MQNVQYSPNTLIFAHSFLIQQTMLEYVHYLVSSKWVSGLKVRMNV